LYTFGFELVAVLSQNVIEDTEEIVVSLAEETVVTDDDGITDADVEATVETNEKEGILQSDEVSDDSSQCNVECPNCCHCFSIPKQQINGMVTNFRNFSHSSVLHYVCFSFRFL